jgi:hypothetical protein
MNGTQAPPQSNDDAFTVGRASLTGRRSAYARASTASAKSTELLSFTELAPPPSIGDADNLLLTTTEGKDVTLTLPYPATSELEVGDTVVLVIDGAIDESTRINVADYNAITLTLPAASHATSGKYTINYELRFDTGLGNTEQGPGQSFVVDYVEPGLPDLAAPDFLFNPALGLTPDRLEADGSLKAHVFGYNGLDLDDKIWGKIDGGTAFEIGVVDHIPVEGEQLPLIFPSGSIAALTDGPHTFGYYVVDRAGNRSPDSAAVNMSSLLTGFISDLLAAIVPEATDGLVDDADARSLGGVLVQIPAHAKLNENYEAVVHWGATTSKEFPIPPGAQNPVAEFTIPYGVAYFDWTFVAGGADQAVPTTVYYEVFLNGIFAGRSAPMNAPVSVNLYLAGGEDPDPETPVHDELVVPTVHSANGAVDTIPVADFDAAGTMIIPFKTAGVKPPAVAAFKDGDVITVQYGTTRPFTYPVTAADITAAVDIQFPLPVDNIHAGQTGQIPVTYTITRKITGGSGTGSNVSLSPTKTITVSSAGDLPGGGATLEAAAWKLSEQDPTPGKENMIGFPQATHGVTIELPLYVNKKENDVISVDLELFAKFAHTDGEPSIVPPRKASKSAIVGSTDVGGITTVVFLYDDLVYLTTPLTMHAHVTYKVRGVGTTVDVGSKELVLKVDCRGTPPGG